MIHAPYTRWPYALCMLDLDATDQQIIALLQSDGRMPHAAIAERIHLSASACLRRVRRLEATGVISGYHAAIDRERVGLGTTIFVEISLDSQHEDHLDEFEAAVAAVPEVIGCHLMAGDFDYLVHVVAADVSDYERIHRTQMARLPHVANVRSSFALRSVVERGTIEGDTRLDRSSFDHCPEREA